MKRKVQLIPVDNSGNLTMTLNIDKGTIIIDGDEVNFLLTFSSYYDILCDSASNNFYIYTCCALSEVHELWRSGMASGKR